MVEAPTGEDSVAKPGCGQTVERGGEAPHQTGAPGPQHLHLVHHVVQPGARIEVLTSYHHQHVLSSTPVRVTLFAGHGSQYLTLETRVSVRRTAEIAGDMLCSVK